MAVFTVKHLPNGRLQLIGKRSNGEEVTLDFASKGELVKQREKLRQSILDEGESVIEYTEPDPI